MQNIQDLICCGYFRAFHGNNRFGGNSGRNGFTGNGGRTGGFGGNSGKPGLGGTQGRNGFGGKNGRTGFQGGDRRGGNGFTGDADRRGSGAGVRGNLKGKQPGGGLVKPQWELQTLRPFSKNFYVPHQDVTNRFVTSEL